MIYNGDYEEQVRAYELAGGRLSQRILAGGGLAVWSSDAPFAPWSGTVAVRELEPARADGIVAALAQAGAFGPPAEGLELESRDFFWTLAACHDGRYHFTAWRQAVNPAFVAPILALDGTGVAFNQPHPVAPRFRSTEPRLEFNLRVGANGLWGVP